MDSFENLLIITAVFNYKNEYYPQVFLKEYLYKV